MVTIYALDISKLDPDDRDWSSWVESRRLEKARLLQFRDDRARCIGAGLLLSFALHSHHPNLPIPMQTELGLHAKPFLPKVAGFHFNLSHSGKWVICAIANLPLGVDIEAKNRNILKIISKSLSKSEREDLQQFPEEQHSRMAVAIWVLKESYIKAKGIGLSLPLSQSSVQAGNPILIFDNGVCAPCSLCLVDFLDDDYYVGLCLMKKQETPLLYRIEYLHLKNFISAP